MRSQIQPFALILSLLWVIPTTGLEAAELTPEELTFFESKIRPVLIRECYGCHSNKAGNVRGGLRLDTKALMHIGGTTGPAIVPGKPDESWLYNAITHQDFVMPPKRKLPQNVIDDFRKWIEMGAPDPRVSEIADIKSKISKADIATARDSFWAYQPISPQAAPKTKDAGWAKTDIDRFVLAKLEQSDMQPARDAAAYQVLRRLSFDLTGLPPDPKRIKPFSMQWKSDPDKAISDLVDEYLASPQFGERWGRHWLDVVRYAESTGREVNMTYPHAWRYRDYVIDSFNDDKPFNQFVQEQLAGDLLPAPDDKKWAENLVATSFLAIGAKNVNEQNRVQFAADVLDEQIDATTRVFLGMSVACARCHDHKFDAIPQADYYALAGIFSNIKTYFGNPPSEYGSFTGVQTRQKSTLMLLPVADPNPFDRSYTKSEMEKLKSDLAAKIKEQSELRRNARSGNANQRDLQRQRIRLANEMASLSDKLAIVDENGRPRSYSMGVQERSNPKNMRVLVRGEIDQPAQTVKRGFPQVLCSTTVTIDGPKSGRLEFARWVGSKQNPLTARVMVNRIWQHMVGHGIVRSTENFGVTGQTPSHPELLDYLASRFIASNWSVKQVVRDIANSRVYRIATDFKESYHNQDADNALLWRAHPRRLDAEALRDAMLSASGELDLKRPRGSEVAKAGYVRVTAGVLGNPRDIARQAAAQMMRSRTSNRFSPRGGSRSRNGFSFDANTRAELERKVLNQLDMEEAKIRSVYLPIVRDEVPRSLAVFDFADASTITGQREISNTPDQALYMMNNRFVIQQSSALARRLASTGKPLKTQVELAFVLTYGRMPTTGERTATENFVKEYSKSLASSNRTHETLKALCQSLFASAEFRYLD